MKDKVFEESCDADKDPTGKLIVDDRDVQRLLDCCLTHTSFVSTLSFFLLFLFKFLFYRSNTYSLKLDFVLL